MNIDKIQKTVLCIVQGEEAGVCTMCKLLAKAKEVK
jgi:hypothetical protein